VLNARKNEVANKTLRNYYYKDRFGKINYDAKKLESDILKYKKFQEDPFSLVRVSDFRPVGQPKVKVTYAINVKKSSGKPGRGPYQIVEALLEGEFEGTITILKYQKSSERRIDSPLSFEEIKGALKGFYGKELEREKKEMEKTGISYKAIQQPTIPIRIGRHSGAECVTIEGFRVIRIMGSNTPGATPTTLWLASEDRSKPQNAMPFGWCSVIEE
jgi:CRISPR-associated protein Csm5